jgi:hypothetical protein
MAVKKKKKTPYKGKTSQGTQSMSMSNPYVNTPVQSNNPGFTFGGSIT